MIAVKLPNGLYHYDPNSPLGRRGGFGQVFAGKASGGVEVAIKKLNLSAADAAHRELRIAEEFRAQPFKYVVGFLDSGEDAESGGYFVVMPRAEKSLQSVVDSEGPLGPAPTAAVLLQITKGLMEVDEIVHRDLKPDNVLFHEGAWKIADFGIARFIEEATRSSTLKDCLTQEYAAPEQWRSERATHATDIYALGCIGFCLLTGGPPFTTDPSEQHQQSPVPSFECADPRLRTLITLMLRKLAPTRPTLLRVEQLLTEIVQHPYTDSSSNAASLLAAVGAEVGIQEQQREAAAEADRRVSQERSALGRAAIEVLSDNLERLWGRIHSNAPNATRHGGAGFQLQCLLGRAVLEAYLPQPTEVCAKGELPKAGWDLVLRGFIRVYGITGVPQGANGVVWVAILLYAKAKGKADYRWHEVSFSKAMDSVPFCSPTSVDADRALALGNRPVLITVEQHVTRIAHGPLEVDDEKEAEFHERWIWLLATAAKNELGYPADIPFSWPPRMLR